MKDLIFFCVMSIIVAPCLLSLSGGDNIIPNIVGVMYIIALYVASKTKVGKMVVKKWMKICVKIERSLK